jgi:hemolysin-activating ACP:hemolysin acyltransferase
MISEKSSLKDLIERSPYHSWWGEKEYELYVARPISLGQCLFSDGVLATWGFPNEDQVEKYLSSRRFDSEWFDGGGDTVWLIDFICLGGKVQIARSFKGLINLFSGLGYRDAYWLRTETGKLGWFKLRER